MITTPIRQPLPRTVYLAGPITGCSYGGCTDWRAAAVEKLPHWIHPVSPMRGKEYLSTETSVGDSYPNHILSCDDGIMSRDSNDVKRCDLILANFLGASKVSIGTVMECAWAWQLGKPVIIVIEADKSNPHEHSMLRKTAGFRCETLDEAFKVAERILSLGV